MLLHSRSSSHDRVVVRGEGQKDSGVCGQLHVCVLGACIIVNISRSIESECAFIS